MLDFNASATGFFPFLSWPCFNIFEGQFHRKCIVMVTTKGIFFKKTVAAELKAVDQKALLASLSLGFLVPSKFISCLMVLLLALRRCQECYVADCMT